MPFVVEVDFRGIRTLQGRFAKATKWIGIKYRDTARKLGRRWVELARDYAPRDTGKFARGIRFYSFVEGTTVGFRGYIPQPLGSYIVGGTKPHKIYAKNTGALFFIWEEQGNLPTLVPIGGGRKTRMVTDTGGRRRKKIGRQMLIIGKGYVQHPGTKSNPFTAHALDMLHVESLEQMRGLSVNYKAIVLQGSEGGR